MSWIAGLGIAFALLTADGSPSGPVVPAKKHSARSSVRPLKAKKSDPKRTPQAAAPECPEGSTDPKCSKSTFEKIKEKILDPQKLADLIKAKIESLQEAMRYNLRPGATIYDVKLVTSKDNPGEQTLTVGFKTQNGSSDLILHDKYRIRGGKLVNFFRVLPKYEAIILDLAGVLHSQPEGHAEWKRTQ